jgi:hypothetical protein
MRRAALVLGLAIAAALALPSLVGANHSVTELVSIGPAGGNGAYPSNYAAVSSDGTRIFFQTSESLVSADTDARIDVYERAGTTTTLVSTGPAGGNGPYNAFLGGLSDDGSKAFVGTSEKLTSDDTDGGQSDVYQRSGGTATLVSTGSGAGAQGAAGAFFDAASADGSRVFFHTRNDMTTDDNDTFIDIFERSAATTTKISPADEPFDVYFAGSSSDGAHVFFETTGKETADDMDSAQDVFDSSGGSTARVSTGPAGGNGAEDAFFDGSSTGGARVFFTSAERLLSADTDSQFDVYERSGGATALVSTAPGSGNGASDASFAGASSDGTRVFFQTDEQLVGGDSDAQVDVYERAAGVTALLSIGPAGGNGAFDASFDGASADGTRVFFDTEEALTADDSDAQVDVFERSSGATTRLSTGGGGGNGAFDADFRGSSADGARVFFQTEESLAVSDADASRDVYERFSGATTQISAGPTGGNGAFAASYLDSSADGTLAFFETSEKLVGEDTDSSLDIYSASVNAGYPRPKGATPLRVSLALAYAACASPNRTHGAPLSSPSCNPPAQSSSRLTVGTLDSNGHPAQSVGSARFDVVPGDSATAADEADVLIAVSMTDVRRRTDLSDYSGELRATTRLRITDRYNGSSPTVPATAADTTFGFTVPCAATVDGTIGAACSVTTSFDTVVPGAVPEGSRSNWELGRVALSDGGSDGLASTEPNEPFAVQGIFIP